jgi:trehalose 6-phosphate phosphatase
MTPATVAELPHALDRKRMASALDGRRPAVFLDYDGVLTPIVERPQDAMMSPGMRETVRALAARWAVCIVSGRDRATVQQLMGMDDLVVAGSHGFEIWIPGNGAIGEDPSAEYRELIVRVTEQLSAALADLDGVRIERKHASVAVHYRQAGPDARARVQQLVDAVLTEHPDRLKVMPGKMVAEIQPGIDWNKGAAVRYLLRILELDSPDIVALYLGDDITDEDAFRALRGVGIGIVVGRPDDPEVADRATEADFALASTDEVQRFLATLAS